MSNPSVAVRDSCQEQGDEVPAFPISRGGERKGVVQIAVLLQPKQSRSYHVLQKQDGAMGKRFEEEVTKEQRNKNPPFPKDEGPNSWDPVQQGPVSGSDEPLNVTKYQDQVSCIEEGGCVDFEKCREDPGEIL